MGGVRWWNGRVKEKRGYNLLAQAIDLLSKLNLAFLRVAFAQDPRINHSLLIVDLSGGDKIAPKFSDIWLLQTL